MRKGQKLTEEQRVRQLAAAKLRMTPDVREKLRQYWTPERRAALGEKLRLVCALPERRAKYSKIQKANWTPERRAAHSIRMKHAYGTPERKAQQSARQKALWADPAYRATQTAALEKAGGLANGRAQYAAKLMDPDFHAYICATRVNMWSNAGRRAVISKVAAKWGIGQRSKLETVVGDWLDAAGIRYTENRRLGRFVPDITLDGIMVIIECDGAYWHSKPGMAERDARKDAYYTAAGYSVVRLAEFDIKRNPAACLARILAAMAAAWREPDGQII
jgi:very-short-patch-repair endonuclease